MLRIDDVTRQWREAASLASHINLYGFWDEQAFLTKSGDLGVALRIGGVDYESLDRAGRDYTVKRLEAAFRTLDEKTRLYQILFKRSRPQIPSACYDNPLVRTAVEQRSAFLAAKADRLFSIEIFWLLMIESGHSSPGWLRALSQLPASPSRSFRQMRSLFSTPGQRSLLREGIERDRMLLQQKVESLSGQLSDLTVVELLGAEETFRLVRRLVNFCPSKTDNARLHGPQRLDWQLCDSELEAHRNYLRLDDYYARTLTLKELPGETRPLLLQGLLDVAGNFHVVTEWHPVENSETRKEIDRRRRHYHNSKTSFLSNLQERQGSAPHDELVDDSKEAAIAELGEALTAIGMEGKSFGEFTLTAVVYDTDRATMERSIAELQRLFTTHDALLYEERYNLLNAFFATVPGNREFNLRKQWASSSNYADLSFLFTVSAGNTRNAHLEREYLAVLETAHATPYYLNLHSGDVAHTLLLGVTGSGKSFTLNFMVQSLQKYAPLTFIFDLGGSYESLTRGFGGAYLNVGFKNPGFTISPFCLQPTHENLNFLYLFMSVLIEAGGRYALGPEGQRALYAAVERTYKLPAELRTLTNFASILGPLGERLLRWTRAGQFGYLFDNPEDTLTFSRFQTFNFDGWSDYPDVLEPLLFYVLHRASVEIERGENAAIFKAFVIDEAWIFLKNHTIRDWITRAEKTWRKKNAAMILATQSVVELLASEMLHIVNESCSTKIFLANPSFDRKLHAEIFQLNDTQLDLLAGLQSKRDLLLIQPELTKKLQLEVDSLTYWIATNNSQDNLRKQKYFARFGPEQGLLRLAEEYPQPGPGKDCQ
jgi:type IV secretion/conjugal transfer VirB4 family ATPase